ncbi:MAG: hypothetical protein A07HB70_01989 [uncultured archaeon A07HB70]|nr:MAG: hypothetical protein A07HB70_01989 [uncultured archaeon A07HB70]
MYERAGERRSDPHEVADECDPDVAAVCYALAYYHANPEEIYESQNQRDGPPLDG